MLVPQKPEVNAGAPSRENGPFGTQSWQERQRTRGQRAHEALDLAKAVADAGDRKAALELIPPEMWAEPYFHESVALLLITGRKAERDLEVISRVFGGTKERNCA